MPSLNVLAINFSDDQFAPINATNHLLSKLASKHITRRLINGSDLGQAQADHFNWLKHPDKVADTVRTHLAQLKVN